MRSLITTSLLAVALLYSSQADAKRHHVRVQASSHESQSTQPQTDSVFGPSFFFPGFGVKEHNTKQEQRRFINKGATVSHPSGCPSRAFCGCGASVEVFGRPIRSLFLATAWFKFPRVSAQSGAVAVRPGHVFVLRHHVQGSIWMVYDANSGGHQTRVHERSISGFTIVMPTSAA